MKEEIKRYVTKRSNKYVPYEYQVLPLLRRWDAMVEENKKLKEENERLKKQMLQIHFKKRTDDGRKKMVEQHAIEVKKLKGNIQMLQRALENKNKEIRELNVQLSYFTDAIDENY